jgi:hypothetical protein
VKQAVRRTDSIFCSWISSSCSARASKWWVPQTRIQSLLWLIRARHQDLRLKEEGREMIYKGPLNRRGGSQGDNGELLVFLLDHALLLAKQKNKAEQYKVYRRVCYVPLSNLLAY